MVEMLLVCVCVYEIFQPVSFWVASSKYPLLKNYYCTSKVKTGKHSKKSYASFGEGVQENGKYMCNVKP